MSQQNLHTVCARTLMRSLNLAAVLMALTLVAAVAGARAASDETSGDTFPASVTAAGVFADASTGESLENPSISADGRYVAFRSAADNLGEHGPAGVNEAYVKDLETGEVTLVSRADGAEGEPANEPGERAGVSNVFIAGDGRYVIFTSDASNLLSGLPAPEEAEEHPLHVYRRDLQTGETELVDRVTGVNGAILDERTPEAEGISEEGRYVLFRDRVEDLEDPAGEHEAGSSTVYVRDMQAGVTTAVSRAGGAEGELANAGSRAFSISANGRYVAFRSAATNLVPGMEANAASQVYVRDLQAATTTLVSRTAATEAAPEGEAGNGSSEDPMLVGTEGCKVAYESAATNLYLFDGAPPATPQVYLTNVCSTSPVTTLVSRANGEDGVPAGEGNAVIPAPLGASADGRYILFTAFSELDGEPSPSASEHLYVRDLDSATTTLLDRADGVNGALAASNPEGASISANGCRVAFTTAAANLTSPAPTSSSLLETYVRQLTPCQAPAGGQDHEQESHEEAGVTAQPGGQQSDTDPGAQSVIATAGQASARCVVPFMRALDLSAVKKKLSAAHCALGRVAYHYNAIAKGGLVEQSLHQGTIAPAATKVSIWISLGHHHRRHAAHRR